MARRTKDEAEQTRQSLMDAAEQVFFKQGVVRTSLQEVASAAGVTRGAIYWHFKDKIDLLAAMSDRAYLPQEDILSRLVQGDPREPLAELQAACREGILLILRDGQRRRVFTILTQKCEYAGDEMAAIMKRRVESKERIFKLFVELFERARSLGQLNPAWSPHIAAQNLNWLIIGLITTENERNPEQLREQDVLDGLDAFFNAVRKA